MQTVLIPKAVLKELEKLSRNFLWGKGDEGRRMHLIAWEKIKRNRDTGGLGIRDLHLQNKAFIMKLCWGIINQPQALWVRCLRAKYGCLEGKIPMVKKRRNQSEVWRAINVVWPEFIKAVKIKLGGGMQTSFWNENWTRLAEPLLYYVERNHDEVDEGSTVRDFVRVDGDWDTQKLKEYLPQWVIDMIRRMNPPMGDGRDYIGLPYTLRTHILYCINHV